MRDSTQAIQNALDRDAGGIAVIWCPDLGLRDWLATQVESLAPKESQPFRTASVEEAIASPHRMALLLPSDEEATVLELDGSRDRFLGSGRNARTEPVVLFLIRDGDGKLALSRTPSLASWIGGSDVDPEQLAEIDAARERESFEARTGRSPEAWLAEWRSGRIAKSSDNFALAYWASFLEER